MISYIGAISPLFEDLKLEGDKIRGYIKDRFKDLTSIIKITFVCSSLLALALSIKSLTIPIFFTFSIVIISDYLNHTYFDKKSSSLALQSLFGQIKIKETIKKLESISFESDSEELEEDFESENLLKTCKQDPLEQPEAYDSDTRPVILILKAKSDHNEALNLYNKDRAITINGDNDKGVRQLEKEYKIFIIDEITNIDEIKERLEKITNPIQHLWILAHGSPNSMQLDDHHQIDNSNLDDLADVMQRKLSINAHVILYSCSTAQKISSGKNIATKFSEILPGRTVWAPQLPTGIMTLNLEEDFHIKVDFWKSKSRLKYLIEKVSHICCLQPFKKIEGERNVTAQIRDGIEYQ